MPGHGSHWETLCDVHEYTQEQLAIDVEEGTLIGWWPCVDVVGGTDRTESVACLQHGGHRLTRQVLLVSVTPANCHELFSGYPVALDGIVQRLTIERVEPWQYGIEAWVHARATSEQVPLTFFDTHYFADGAHLQPDAEIDVSLAALAYWLRPIQVRSFEIAEGPLWEIERERRREAGEPPESLDRPVSIHTTGGAIFLPTGDEEAPDDAQIQGVIEAIDCIEHLGQRVYRLEIVVMRPGDDVFRLPVFAAERVLDGYVPRIGDDVEGIVWMQGRMSEQHHR
jgi:hypothetical protein